MCQANQGTYLSSLPTVGTLLVLVKVLLARNEHSMTSTLALNMLSAIVSQQLHQQTMPVQYAAGQTVVIIHPSAISAIQGGALQASAGRIHLRLHAHAGSGCLVLALMNVSKCPRLGTSVINACLPSHCPGTSLRLLTRNLALQPIYK